jgi:hypothetical protein
VVLRGCVHGLDKKQEEPGLVTEDVGEREVGKVFLGWRSRTQNAKKYLR